MSYIGLWSYHNFNSGLSTVVRLVEHRGSSTACASVGGPKLKIEPWLINGWQSYAKFNSIPGVGGQVRYTPTGNLILIGNQYFIGTDALNNPIAIAPT